MGPGHKARDDTCGWGARGVSAAEGILRREKARVGAKEIVAQRLTQCRFIPRPSHQKAAPGRTIHWATGERPALRMGMTGIRSR